MKQNLPLKVFGIGLNKTGTKTLGKCFEILGFKNKSYDSSLLKELKYNNWDNIISTVRKYDTFEDWPWPLLYQNLDTLFPNSKFVLTLRKDSSTWFRSLSAHATHPTEARKQVYGYGMPIENPEHHISYYTTHNEKVITFFKGRPEKLLVVSWENGSGWKELANFLEKPIPNVPFPHANKTMSFKN